MAVIGAGSWGTTIGALISRRAPTVLWARRDEIAKQIQYEHRNPRYLADRVLPDQLMATSSLEEALSGATMIVWAIPSSWFRMVAVEAAPFTEMHVVHVSLTKGLEAGSRKRMSEVIAELYPHDEVSVVGGPSFAREILDGQPCTNVVACRDRETALLVRQMLETEYLHIETVDDVVGLEIASAGKNVIALAAGMADGCGFGANTRATILLKGLDELERVGVALGGMRSTFLGVGGLGDLVATCTTPDSRNYSAGFQLSTNLFSERSSSGEVGDMKVPAEGVVSARPLLELAIAALVEARIVSQVVAVLGGELKPSDAIRVITGG